MSALLLEAQLTVDTLAVITHFGNSNAAGKAIVVILLGLSIWGWSTMWSKRSELQLMERMNRAMRKRLLKKRSALDFNLAQLKKAKGPFGRLAHAAAESYYGNRIAMTTASRLRLVDNAIQRSMSDVILRYESKMVQLGSIVAGAPFLGLLGTVWGVMDSFGGIAQEGTGTIQALAPGVSGALLTTVAALVVAIPSVFGYNWLLSEVRRMSAELENFAIELSDGVSLEAYELENQQEQVRTAPPPPVEAEAGVESPTSAPAEPEPVVEAEPEPQPMQSSKPPEENREQQIVMPGDEDDYDIDFGDYDTDDDAEGYRGAGPARA